MNRIQMGSRQTTVRLIGGLGNQLFIYYAGLYVSKKFNTKFVCDTSFLDSDRTKHGVSIASFALEGEFLRKPKWSLRFAKVQDRFTSGLSSRSSLFKKLYQKVTKYYYCSGVGYDPGLENLHRSVTLMGYFQTWRYAVALEEKNKMPLKIQNPSPWFSQLALIAQHTCPIVIHVRRGDYLEDVNSFIGVLGPKYYRNALDEIRKVGMIGPVWVFSDDMESAKLVLNLNIDENINWIVAPKGTDPAEELALMQYGGAHIIANSTFSWWGAYLSHSTKLVIAPSSWFKNQSEPLDLIPPKWKRIENDWL